MATSSGSALIVFAGPTISASEIQEIVAATVRGPAKRGDVYLATLERPRAIAIVDGYFDQTPSVWHKELLWALISGVPVFGSSSMGALRAAELNRFGMVGVGKIYDALIDGVISADDEVVVAHESAERGFRSTSEALVNMSASFAAAAHAGVISQPARAVLEQIAHELFYAERTYSRVLQTARTASPEAAEWAALEAWLPTGRIDQKKRDAEEMLRTLRDTPLDRPCPSFAFQKTDAWLRLTTTLDQRARTASSVASDWPLLPEAVRLRALLRSVAMNEAANHQSRLTAAEIDRVVVDFRRERGLERAEDFERWLRASFADESALRAFFVEEAFVRALLYRHETAARAYVASALIAEDASK